MVEAVIFDLDGVLVDSEGVWNDSRQEVALEHGGRWRTGTPRAMMGMSSVEWSAYMHDVLAVELAPAAISAEVSSRLRQLYSERVPLIPGALDAVGRVAADWPLALASSANREIIDLVLELTGLATHFAATVSSEEVPRGKPAPDVYLEAARRIHTEPERCAAIEDSSNGLRSAAAAGMVVLAVPNRAFPPEDDALALAADVLGSIAELTPTRIERAESRT
jgi:HAD superfamily hydrolase (TIGR01509 family)